MKNSEKNFQKELDFFLKICYNLLAMKEYTVNVINITWDREDENLPKNIEQYVFESEGDSTEGWNETGFETGYEIFSKDLRTLLSEEFGAYPDDIEDIEILHCIQF